MVPREARSPANRHESSVQYTAQRGRPPVPAHGYCAFAVVREIQPLTELDATVCAFYAQRRHAPRRREALPITDSTVVRKCGGKPAMAD